MAKGRKKGSGEMTREIHVRVTEKDIVKISMLEEALKISKSEVIRMGIEVLCAQLKLDCGHNK